MVSGERNVKTRYERDWGSGFFSLSPLHKAHTLQCVTSGILVGGKKEVHKF